MSGNRLTAFHELDAYIASRSLPRRTLDPSREESRSFLDLATSLDIASRGEPLIGAVGEMAAAVVRAVEEHFPENIFSDYALLVASSLSAAEASVDPLETLRETGDLLVQLQALFGCHSTVRFRYVHDLIYGYDWAKWVRRDPQTRADVGPFDLRFLRYMHQRGVQLLGLIAEDDSTYPQLRGSAPRNPFGFDRNPPAEVLLHERLVQRGELPVRAYLLADSPVWDRPYQELRTESARALGLVRA